MIPRLKCFLLCDAINMSNGKFSFIGNFTVINSPKFPAIHPIFFIVTRWGDVAGEDFKQEVKIVEDSTGQIIFSSKNFESGFRIPNEDSEYTIIGRIEGTIFPRKGKYRVELYLNENFVTKINLFLVEIPVLGTRIKSELNSDSFLQPT